MNDLSPVDFKNQRSSWCPEKKMLYPEDPSKKLVWTAKAATVMIVLVLLYVAAKAIFQF